MHTAIQDGGTDLHRGNGGGCVTILLVEDDPGHARLIQKNFERANLANEIIHLSDGQAAMDYLFSEGAYRGAELPEMLLVLLDLNLPIHSGFEVLQRMKADTRTRSIPVVVLTTTDDSTEVDRCYDLGCNVYVTKPVEYEKFTEAMRKLGYLLTIVAVPHRPKGGGP